MIDRATTRCGCPCACHADEGKPEWPGPCAACCDPELGVHACDCTRAITARLMRSLRRFEDAADIALSLQTEASQRGDLNTYATLEPLRNARRESRRG